MDREHIRSALTTGIIFGILIIFLVLIGFTVTGSQLIGNALKLSPKGLSSGLTPQMVNLLIFLGLLGIWAGARGARRSEPDAWGPALLGGLSAGALTGLLTGVLAYILGTLDSAGAKMSTYFAQLLPSSIKLFLLGKGPLQGALFYVLFFIVIGIVGALLARGVVRAAWRQHLWERMGGRMRSSLEYPAVEKVRNHPVFRYSLYGVLLLIIFLLPLRIGQYWNYTLGTVGIYVLLGLGLNIVVGLAGLLDLGYVAFFAIGAYTAALLTAPKPHDLLWSFWIALPIGVALAALAGILLGIPVLRLRGDYLAIVTLGFGEIIRTLSRSDLLTSFSGGPKGVPNVGGPTLFGKPFNSSADFVYIILLAVLLVIFVTRRLQNSRVGRAWIAMREDEPVALAMGVNTLKHKLLAFAIGAAFAGLGGALFASRNQFTGPEDHTLMVSINVLCLVIVGGMGSIPGVIAGAFALKGLPEALRELENYRVLVFGALLVIMMIIRPEGLLPSARRRLEVHETNAEEVLPSAVPEKGAST
ncbi:MAG: ABC transporter permease subunit [Bacteroidota bacterium]